MTRPALAILGLGEIAAISIGCAVAASSERLSIALSTQPIVATGTTIVEADLFDTSTGAIAGWKAKGLEVQCYFSAGTWENWRPDAKSFPKAVRGKEVGGWPGEYWLDVRATATKTSLAARLDLAKAKGCDRVDPDNVDGYANKTGFPLKKADSLDFTKWLATEAHKRGMRVALKNAPDLMADLAPSFDAAIVESCTLYGWCDRASVFATAGKPVFMIEYPELGVDKKAACANARKYGYDLVFKKRSLDAWEERCP